MEAGAGVTNYVVGSNAMPVIINLKSNTSYYLAIRKTLLFPTKNLLPKGLASRTLGVFARSEM